MNSKQMLQLEHLTSEQLVLFFHCKKTEMSCMEEPQIFLNQLRDCYLVPEDLYKKVTKARSKKTKQKTLYEILDYVEKERWQCMMLFWSTVFQDHILQQYPLFRLYQISLLEEQKNTEQKKTLKRKKIADETEDLEPGPSSGSLSNLMQLAKMPKMPKIE